MFGEPGSLFKNMNFNQIIKTIKDYIFPIFCLGCKKEGEWLCDSCYKRLDLSGVFFCPVCHRSQEGGAPCLLCQRNCFVESEIAVTKYHEDLPIGHIVRTLKYDLAEDVLKIIEQIITDFLKNNPNLIEEVDCIIPVPLHKKRLAERGFNQAELIANILGKQIHKPVKNVLQRIRHTTHQSKLSRKKRLQNVIGAFDIDFIPPARVLLVDDVYTTGSTMGECAKELKKHGVDKIYAFTLARG